MQFNKIYDVIIIGGGPAGLNAALYAKRKGLDCLIITNYIGGQMINTTDIDNYLGFPRISGPTLVEEFLNHIISLEIPYLSPVFIESITKPNKDFLICLDNLQTLKAKTIIFATGGLPRKLGVKGEAEFASRGVSYCTTCDAFFFRNKEVVVAGGGNSAAEAVLDLLPLVKKLTVVHRSSWRADKILLDRFPKSPKLTIYLNTQILSINGHDSVEYLHLLNKEISTEFTLKTDGVFVEIGVEPNSDLVRNLVALNDKREIIVDEDQMTSLPGLFAAGDVTNQPYKQIIIATAQGAIAGLAVNNYLKKIY